MNTSALEYPSLRIYTFGRLKVVQVAAAGQKGEAELTGFRTAKEQALLIYLACTNVAHSRETLAGLLWSDMPEEKAQRNLRNALSTLRKIAGHHLSFAQHKVKLIGDVWVDSAEITTLLQTNQQYAKADFLSEFAVRNAPLFNDWADSERARLRDLVQQTLLQLAQEQLEAKQLTDCQNTARQVLDAEPWSEIGHRLLITALAQDGQRAAALKQYDVYRAVLDDELGIEPSAETKRLIEQLTTKLRPIQHNLPPRTRPFIGREQELAVIRSRFGQRSARLINVVGVGGIGKTSLALEAARRAVKPKTGDVHFSDGVYYVPLAEINRTVRDEHLAIAIFTAIANAVGYTFQSQTQLGTQLGTFFRDKKLLLVLDNLEHLLDQSYLLPRLLQAAPNVQVLVTSRERLNLIEEWALPLDGLMLPADSSTEAIIESEAAKLFIRHAERTVGTFTVSENASDIADVCRAVDGLPLGIELAASWLRVIPARQIASEVQRSFDFLSSSTRNLPTRHRSLRAVFESTWQLLSDVERTVLERLSIFRGTFTRDAASVVADASLPMLISLNDKSLVTRLNDTQYTLVEYIRNYVAEFRNKNDTFDAQIHDAHLNYYSRWLSGHTERLIGKDPHISMRAITAQQENIIGAWYWAVQRGDAEAIERMHIPLGRYWRNKGLYVCSMQFMESALARFSAETHPTLHPKLLLEYAFLQRGASVPQDAIETLLRAATQLDSVDDPVSSAAAHLNLGRFLRDLGLNDDSQYHLEIAETIIVPAQMPFLFGQLKLNHGISQRVKTMAAMGQNDADTLTQTLQRERRLFSDARDIFHEHQHIRYEALTLNWLGTALKELGETTKAEKAYRTAATMLEDIETSYGITAVYLNLVELALHNGQVEKALDVYRNSYRTAMQEGDRQPLCHAVYMASGVYQALEQPENAITMMACLVNSPELVDVMRNHCARELTKLAKLVDPQQFEAAQTRGELATVDNALAIIATDFEISQ